MIRNATYPCLCGGVPLLISLYGTTAQKEGIKNSEKLREWTRNREKSKFRRGKQSELWSMNPWITIRVPRMQRDIHYFHLSPSLSLPPKPTTCSFHPHPSHPSPRPRPPRHPSPLLPPFILMLHYVSVSGYTLSIYPFCIFCAFYSCRICPSFLW